MMGADRSLVSVETRSELNLTDGREFRMKLQKTALPMRFTRRFLPPNAAAYALLVLTPLTAHTQDLPTPEIHGIVVANMDRSVTPGDDFYRYANGDWIKRTEIPPDRRYIDPNGLDFDGSNDLSRKRIDSLIEEATKTNAPAGSNARKIADFYHSYMDEAAIEAKGLAPPTPRRNRCHPRQARASSGFG